MAHILSGLWALFLKHYRSSFILSFWHRSVPWLLYGVVFVLQDCTTILFYVMFLLIGLLIKWDVTNDVEGS